MVPYVPMGSEFGATSIEIRGITTDFESMEVNGIVLALEAATAAPQDLQIEKIMFGCDVHFDRDVEMRACELKTNISGQL